VYFLNYCRDLFRFTGSRLVIDTIALFEIGSISHGISPKSCASRLVIPIPYHAPAQKSLRESNGGLLHTWQECLVHFAIITPYPFCLLLLFRPIKGFNEHSQFRVPFEHLPFWLETKGNGEGNQECSMKLLIGGDRVCIQLLSGGI
jgi:hypothetical protein